MYRFILLSLFSAFTSLANAQSALQHNNMLFVCKGLGQAVATITLGREQGVPDDENEGIEVLRKLKAHSGNDFENQVETFMLHADSLPALWQGMLYTHACINSYQDDNAQISVMAAQLPYRCDMEAPSMGCIDKTFLSLPGPALRA